MPNYRGAASLYVPPSQPSPDAYYRKLKSTSLERPARFHTDVYGCIIKMVVLERCELPADLKKKRDAKATTMTPL